MKLLFTLVIFASTLFSQEYSFKNNFNLDSILSTKEWNQLISYKNNKSEINDSKFFLSEQGNINPKEELLATLNNYSSIEVNNDSAVCKFPARYLFLSNFVDFKDYKMINSNCSSLKNWEFLNKTESISIMLVSGYISNPASTFGHSFIKLNTKNNDLFSASINYGAMVPENENMVKYILKGLSGFYQAGFSDKYFYNQDLTYTDTEFRDMWEYKLNLTPYQQNLILLHIWEVAAKKYDYYFLNKNCGYRVNELFNLVSHSDLNDKNDLWFLPIETFQDLENKESDFIKEVKFIPSNKRVFNEYFGRFNESNKSIIRGLLLSDFSNLSSYNNLSEDDKIQILDFLILYYKQSLTVDPSNQKFEQIKKQLIIERFKYRVSKSEKLNIKEIDSPAKNTNPINFELSAGNDNENKYLGLAFSPYKQSSLGISNLEFDNLIALEGRVIFNEDSVILDKFDFLKINKINVDTNNVLNEFKYNWNLHIGVEEINSQRQHFAKFGVGYNLYHYENFILYSFVNGSVNDTYYLSVIPSIGTEFKYNKMAFRFIQEKEVSLAKNEKSSDISNFNIQYNFSKNYNINYELKVMEDNYKNFVNFKLSF